MIPLRYMGRLFEQIKRAVQEDRFLVGWHADERSEERGVTDWQIVRRRVTITCHTVIASVS